MKILPFLALHIFLVAVSAQASLLMTSKSGSTILNQSQFPAAMKAGVEILNGKCDLCHDLSRVVKPLETGKAADGSSFGKADIKAYVVKKMRRPGVILSQQEAREVIKVLEYIQGEIPDGGRSR